MICDETYAVATYVKKFKNCFGRKNILRFCYDYSMRKLLFALMYLQGAGGSVS